MKFCLGASRPIKQTNASIGRLMLYSGQRNLRRFCAPSFATAFAEASAGKSESLWLLNPFERFGGGENGIGQRQGAEGGGEPVFGNLIV